MEKIIEMCIPFLFRFFFLFYLLNIFFNFLFHLPFSLFSLFLFLELTSCQELNTKLVWKVLSPSTTVQVDDAMNINRMKHDNLGLNKLGDNKLELRLGDHIKELRKEGEEGLEMEFLNIDNRTKQEKRESITSESDRQNDLFGIAEFADSNEKFLSSMEGSSELDEPFHKLKE